MSVASRMAANAAKFPDLDIVRNGAHSWSRVHSRALYQHARISIRLDLVFERSLRCWKCVAVSQPKRRILACKQIDRAFKVALP